ncbi:MAG: 4-alpha-glucanotransferase [Dehalococcoidia bacterium]
MPSTSIPGLRALARLCGVQSSYYDALGRQRTTSPSALIAVLQSFGVAVETAKDVPGALRERRLELARRTTPPVVVVWEGVDGVLPVRMLGSATSGVLRAVITFEDGSAQALRWDLGDLSPTGREEVEGERFLHYDLPLPAKIPLGYHRLRLDNGSHADGTLIVAAPRACVSGPVREWGVFLPLHALRRDGDWGVGDYSGLETLARWAAGHGASTVGTLPLLPTFLDEPLEPSPYAPVSRLAWNPIFLDVSRLPGGDGADPVTPESISGHKGQRYVDYAKVMAAKRAVLDKAADWEANAASIERFARDRPVLNAYAQFMATLEHMGKAWRQWPDPQRSGSLSGHDYDLAAWRYHLFAQLACARQIEDLDAAEGAADLYLDYPVGVHPDGFDVWREQHRFVTDVSVGAPPDAFFTKGQDWGFNPLHPERSAGHGYFIESLRHHMRHASLLRLDHVMGLHRLYWIPRGGEASDGAYVRYPAEEMYAVLCLESHRNGTGIVGEDLGTVPPIVPRAMGRHGLKRMFILQFSVFPERHRSVQWPSRGTVTSANTHDTPSFAGYWRGLDIDDRRELGLLDARASREEKADRAKSRKLLADWLHSHGYLDGADWNNEDAVMRAVYRGLAASRADMLLVNVEDLWLEPAPQNVPGTSSERPNWRRKARYTVEEFMSQPGITDLLLEITQLRRRTADEREESQADRSPN